MSEDKLYMLDHNFCRNCGHPNSESKGQTETCEWCNGKPRVFAEKYRKGLVEVRGFHPHTNPYRE